MNEFGITDSHLHIIRSIFKQYQAINKVLIYGSRAKGNYSERSDVDLVICDTTFDRKTIGKILLAINNSDFPYTVDLQIMENIKNKNLQEHIKRVGKEFYTKM
uniref:Polymerase beta nucleotidyltransferase domain-containing protein n=1 Tax=Chlorobium chlorochromatii (strain CaD3) TaxID=340177 RepID=Q3AT08_CHLCH